MRRDRNNADPFWRGLGGDSASGARNSGRHEYAADIGVRNLGVSALSDRVDLADRDPYKAPTFRHIAPRWPVCRLFGVPVCCGNIWINLPACGSRAAQTRAETFRETHLSTQPHRAQAPPRLPQADADGRRSEGSGAPSRQGPQAAFGIELPPRLLKPSRSAPISSPYAAAGACLQRLS